MKKALILSVVILTAWCFSASAQELKQESQFKGTENVKVREMKSHPDILRLKGDKKSINKRGSERHNAVRSSDAVKAKQPRHQFKSVPNKEPMRVKQTDKDVKLRR
ncbi:MAG: hypothetical protein IJ681_05105 [Bacteroidales bacterium]|nr:hypothetical protein [Bacteroidales bacterium]